MLGLRDRWHRTGAGQTVRCLRRPPRSRYRVRLADLGLDGRAWRQGVFPTFIGRPRLVGRQRRRQIV
ncbi:MAG TPA: hypothetical protein VFW03_07540 [Gemmatimonadaceae bacterium]|nr:hypothetical protein [Gemmatimonadaceae bacterium]